MIAPYTEGVLLSVLTDVSRMPRISEAHQRLSAIGVRVLGAVYSGDRASSYGSSYYDRGRNYSRASVPTPSLTQTESDGESQ